MEMFSSFSFCLFIFPLEEKQNKTNILQLRFLCESANTKQKVGFQNAATKAGLNKFLFQPPTSMDEERELKEVMALSESTELIEKLRADASSSVF